MATQRKQQTTRAIAPPPQIDPRVKKAIEGFKRIYKTAIRTLDQARRQIF